MGLGRRGSPQILQLWKIKPGKVSAEDMGSGEILLFEVLFVLRLWKRLNQAREGIG
jgi:hypothetical protein